MNFFFDYKRDMVRELPYRLKGASAQLSVIAHLDLVLYDLMKLVRREISVAQLREQRGYHDTDEMTDIMQLRLHTLATEEHTLMVRERMLVHGQIVNVLRIVEYALACDADIALGQN